MHAELPKYLRLLSCNFPVGGWGKSIFTVESYQKRYCKPIMERLLLYHANRYKRVENEYLNPYCPRVSAFRC